MRSGEIKALTGLRIIAAVWVVLFHFRPLLHDAAPAIRRSVDAGAQLRRAGRRPVLHSQRVRPDVELPGHDGTVLVGARHAALPVAAAGPGLAGVPGHHASGRAVGDLHPERGPRADGGHRRIQRGQLRPPAVPGAAVVPAVLRRLQLGRPGLVDQRGMAGLPVVRSARGGHLPDGAGHPGAQPDAAGLRRVAAAGAAVVDQRALLHPVELVAADPAAVHRRRVGLRRGTQAQAHARRPGRRWVRGRCADRRHRRPALSVRRPIRCRG